MAGERYRLSLVRLHEWHCALEADGRLARIMAVETNIGPHDLLEKRRRQNRPMKVVEVQRRVGEDRDAAQERHFTAHPEDADADVVIFQNLRR